MDKYKIAYQWANNKLEDQNDKLLQELVAVCDDSQHGTLRDRLADAMVEGMTKAESFNSN